MNEIIVALITGGAFKGTPSINTTYYLSTDNIVVHETTKQVRNITISTASPTASDGNASMPSTSGGLKLVILGMDTHV